MSISLTLMGEVSADHTLTVVVVEDVPVGPAEVTLTIVEESVSPLRTLGDSLNHGFVGMYANRADLPTTTEEFTAWRKKLW